MISTMGMEDTFMQMAVTISEIGWMERDQDGESMLISLERYRKVCGSIQNLWEVES